MFFNRFSMFLNDFQLIFHDLHLFHMDPVSFRGSQKDSRRNCKDLCGPPGLMALELMGRLSEACSFCSGRREGPSPISKLSTPLLASHSTALFSGTLTVEELKVKSG